MVTIHGPDISTNLIDMPILIYLSSSSGVFKQDLSSIFTLLGSYSNRKKIAVTTYDGIIQCYVEIERWDQVNGKAWLWVKVPTIYRKRNTNLFLYYDPTSDDNVSFVGDIGEVPAQSVWDSNFKAVWHMNNGPSSNILDSTINAKNGTKSPNPSTEVDSLIGKGQSFNGSNNYISTPSLVGSNATGEYSIESVVTSTGTVNQSIYHEGVNSPQGAGTNWLEDTFFTGQHQGYICGNNPSGWTYKRSLSTYTSSYYHLATRKFKTSGIDRLKLLIDGYEPSYSLLSTNPVIAGIFNTASIGRRYGYLADVLYNDYYFNGIISEVRIHNIDRGDDWFKVSAASCKDTIISYGSIRTRKVTVNSSQVLYNGAFQVYFKIENDSNIGNYIVDTSKGCDIFFTDSLNELLPFEKINFEWTSTSSWKYEAFVRLPYISTSSNVDFFLNYGLVDYVDYSCPHATFPEDDGFIGVYHTIEPYWGSKSYKDATGHEYHGSPSSNIITSDLISGKIGKAINFDDAYTDDKIVLPQAINANLNGIESLSVMKWLKLPTVSPINQAILNFDITGNSSKVFVGISNSATGDIQIGGRTSTLEALQSKVSAGGQFTAGQWHHLVSILDIPNDNVHCYKDSLPVALSGSISWSGTSLTSDVGNSQSIGNSSDDLLPLYGQICELWVIKGIISANKLSTYYANQNNPSLFYTVEATDTETNWKFSPNRGELGTSYRFPLQIRNHDRYTGYTCNAGFSQVSGNLLYVNSGNTSCGEACIFASFSKVDINDKWLSIAVGGFASSSGSGDIAILRVYDGVLDRTNNAHFPTNLSISLPLLLERTILPYTTVDTTNSIFIPTNFDTSTGTHVTICITLIDYSNTIAFNYYLKDFRLINRDGTSFAIACMGNSGYGYVNNFIDSTEGTYPKNVVSQGVPGVDVVYDSNGYRVLQLSGVFNEFILFNGYTLDSKGLSVVFKVKHVSSYNRWDVRFINTNVGTGYGDFISVGSHTSDTDFTIREYINGVSYYRVVGSFSYTGWHYVKINIEGSTFSASIDSTSISYTSTYLNKYNNGVGLNTWSGCVNRFSNIVVNQSTYPLVMDGGLNVSGTYGDSRSTPVSAYKSLFRDDLESNSLNKWSYKPVSTSSVQVVPLSTLPKGRYGIKFTGGGFPTADRTINKVFPRSYRCLVSMKVLFSGTPHGYLMTDLSRSKYFIYADSGYLKYINDSSVVKTFTQEQIQSDQWYHLSILFCAPNLYYVSINEKYLGAVAEVSFDYIDILEIISGNNTGSNMHITDIDVKDLSQPVGKYMSEWYKRHLFTVNKEDVNSTVDNFPIYLPISNSAGKNNKDITGVFSELGSNYKKIAVTIGDGVTQCNIEKENWRDDLSKADLWFGGNASNSLDTNYYLYYSENISDNTDFVGDIGSTPAQKVWDADYLAVWHMKDVAGQVKESTLNDRSSTKFGPVETDGIIDKAQLFDGVNDYINVTNQMIGNVPLFTVEAMVNTYSTLSHNKMIYNESNNTVTGNTFYDFEIDTSGKPSIHLQSALGSSMEFTSDIDVRGSWTHIASKRVSTDSARTLINGTEYPYSTSLKGVVGSANFDISSIGRYRKYNNDTGSFYEGVLDELRLSKIDRPNGWISSTNLSNRDLLLVIEDLEIADIIAYRISGSVRQLGLLVERGVCLYLRSTGELKTYMLSNTPSIGYFEFIVNNLSDYYIVVLDEDNYNALVFDRVKGVL